MNVTILGIESSCDDTSAAILQNGAILSNITANQDAHKEYGGVVPEVASRAHQQNIVPVIDLAIQKAGIKKTDIDAIAFTRGPGLIGSLLVGVSFAKAMSLSLGIPMVEVNHMQAHVLAHFAEDPKPTFPFLCLTVSGGHTQLVVVKDYLDMEVIGSTIDDAAGEAFDKTGKLLGLDYPAGPLIDKYAQLGEPRFKFAEPNLPQLDFSFSGLKTSILYFLKKEIKSQPNFIQDNLHDICASVQQAIINSLMIKLIQASKETGIKEIAVAGGVSANSGLRTAILTEGKIRDWNCFIPRIEYCTDNAAMIAVTGYHKYLHKDFIGQEVVPIARWGINSLNK